MFAAPRLCPRDALGIVGQDTGQVEVCHCLLV